MILEQISKNKVYYMFRCDDPKRGDIPTDKSFSLTETTELGNLLAECKVKDLKYDLVVQEWDEDKASIINEVYIVELNYINQ